MRRQTEEDTRLSLSFQVCFYARPRCTVHSEANQSEARPAVPDIDQSEARVSGSFPNSVCVLSRQTARGQKKHRQSIINIRLSPKYFCERFSDLVIFRLRSIRRIMLRGPWMPSWSGLRRAAGKSSQRTRTLTTPRYQRWIKYFTGIFSLFPSFLIIPSPQMENQGIILYLNWSKNISSSLGSNSAPSNPGADYNWSVNIFLILIFSSAQNLGKIWKTLTDEQQAPFRKEAENLRYLHQLEYPDYKYRPKKRQRSGTEAAQQVHYTLCTRVQS